MKAFSLLFICVFLIQCRPKPENEQSEIMEIKKDSVKNEIQERNTNDTFSELTKMQKVDSMLQANDFSIDTNRLKQIYFFNRIRKNKINFEDSLISYEVPFPFEKIEKHFLNPKTYFYVKKGDSTRKYGMDFLLMTWELDSSALQYKIDLMFFLQGRMGNFPVYSFMNKNKIYSVVNRQSICAEYTLDFCKKVQEIINKETIIYGWNLYYENRQNLQNQSFKEFLGDGNAE